MEREERAIIVEEWWNIAQNEECVLVKHFKHRSLLKYTRVARGQNGVEVKNMIDLTLVKRYMLQYVHHVVLCKVSLVGAWIKRREAVVGSKRIGSEKLR